MGRSLEQVDRVIGENTFVFAEAFKGGAVIAKEAIECGGPDVSLVVLHEVSDHQVGESLRLAIALEAEALRGEHGAEREQ